MSNIQNTQSGLPPEAEDRFEVELCWCIQQLENSLQVDMKQKEAETAMRSLNILKSNNSSLIRKRQVMRNTFGDYRKKMTDDEKKFGKTSATLKFIAKGKSSQKSVFLKTVNKPSEEKTKESKSQKTVSKAIIDVSEKNEPFKFNFVNPET